MLGDFCSPVRNLLPHKLMTLKHILDIFQVSDTLRISIIWVKLKSCELFGDISPPQCVRCCCSSGSRTGSPGLFDTTEAPRYAWAWSDSGNRLLCLSRCSRCWWAPSLLHERTEKSTGTLGRFFHFQSCTLEQDLPSCFMMFNRDFASSRPAKREHRRSGSRVRLSWGVSLKKSETQ